MSKENAENQDKIKKNDIVCEENKSTKSKIPGFWELMPVMEG